MTTEDELLEVDRSGIEIERESAGPAGEETIIEEGATHRPSEIVQRKLMELLDGVAVPASVVHHRRHTRRPQ